MRIVKIYVGGTPIGKQRTWAYPAGQALGLYEIPVYRCSVEGKDDSGKAVKEFFDVLRFGVHCTDGKTAKVVGLADPQMHVIKSWIPTYRVHSAASPENGAWQVMQNFLIHDGPDNPGEIFATIGCVEIMGPGGFVRFNDLVIALSGSRAATREQRLNEIGRAGKMFITYERAARPLLKKAP